jgi:RNA polymerase sigma-70 factor (ECF subfamily)
VSILAASAHDSSGLTAGRRPTSAPSVPTAPLTFDAVYDEHFAFVWRSARRLGIAPSALDDVVQDVFVVVHRRLADFEGKSSAKSWLFGIVLHVVRDVRRTLRRKPAQLGGAGRSGDDVGDVVDIDGSSPHDSAAKREAVQMLHTILEAMPDDQREVFILSELEQMSVPEIAAAVGANTNTVYSRLRAARADFERAVARAQAGDEWRMR